MVTDVIVPPAGVAGARADGGGWVTLVEDLEPRALQLSDLILLPPLKHAVVPAVPTLRIWEVLAAWRAAEREMSAIPDASPEWPRVHAELVGLRAAYHRLFHERMQSTHQVVKVARNTFIVWQ
jgi:hypothetical protein